MARCAKTILNMNVFVSFPFCNILVSFISVGMLLDTFRNCFWGTLDSLFLNFAILVSFLDLNGFLDVGGGAQNPAPLGNGR